MHWTKTARVWGVHFRLVHIVPLPQSYNNRLVLMEVFLLHRVSTIWSVCVLTIVALLIREWICDSDLVGTTPFSRFHYKGVWCGVTGSSQHRCCELVLCLSVESHHTWNIITSMIATKLIHGMVALNCWLSILLYRVLFFKYQCICMCLL